MISKEYDNVVLVDMTKYADEKYFQDAAGIHYQNDDGTFVTSSWVEVSNLWFLFDANGICVNPTGALAPDDTDGNSQMKRGCLELSVFRHPFLSNSLIDFIIYTL